jgi:hypothetical protein
MNRIRPTAGAGDVAGVVSLPYAEVARRSSWLAQALRSEAKLPNDINAWQSEESAVAANFGQKKPSNQPQPRDVDICIVKNETVIP